MAVPTPCLWAELCSVLRGSLGPNLVQMRTICGQIPLNCTDREAPIIIGWFGVSPGQRLAPHRAFNPSVVASSPTGPTRGNPVLVEKLTSQADPARSPRGL